MVVGTKLGTVFTKPDVIGSRHRMKIDPKREKLWQKLEVELQNHGLEVVSRDDDFETRAFIAHVRNIGGKKEIILRFSYISLDDWRQNQIDGAIARAQKALKQTLSNPPSTSQDRA